LAVRGPAGQKSDPQPPRLALFFSPSPLEPAPLLPEAAAMSAVNITNVAVLDNPTAFLNPFQFEISYECLVPLDDGTDPPPPFSVPATRGGGLGFHACRDRPFSVFAWGIGKQADGVGFCCI